MRVTVIGWYGTETIGDRGILAGLLSFFGQAFNDFSINLGSLNPFFSARTLSEDKDFYEELIGKSIEFDIFNSKSSNELKQALKNSDMLVMGGGPLMDLSELYMVEYAFRKARKMNIATAILGCGVGPLFSRDHRKSVLNIFSNSDLSIVRDEKSKEFLSGIVKEFDHSFMVDDVLVSLDPAVEATLKISLNSSRIIPVNVRNNYVAVNLREFPSEYSSSNCSEVINNSLVCFVEKLADKFKEKDILLIPMHYFHVGNDDRVFLNYLSRRISKENVYVQNDPINLKSTIELFRNADFNIGMRFHSVVLQTLSSGKNYVLDYTEPKRGKINGFLNDIDHQNFYQKRYVCLQEDELSAEIIEESEITNKFSPKYDEIYTKLGVYVSSLQYLKNESINRK